MNEQSPIPEDLIRRPDGSFVSLKSLEPREQLAHELVSELFPQAVQQSEALAALKKLALQEMYAFRDNMFMDYQVKVTGREGGFSCKSVCGTMMVKLDVNQHTAFGPELGAAKALIDQFIEEKLEGSSDEIKAIIDKVFKIGASGRVDTYGILGLREHKFTDPLWLRAIEAIEDAIIRDGKTIYIRFYRVDPETKAETMVPLDLAKVPMDMSGPSLSPEAS